MGISHTVYFPPLPSSGLETTRRILERTGDGGRGLERKEGMAMGEMKGVAVVIWSFNRLHSRCAGELDGSPEGMEVPLADVAWAA
jgi:hypothetical protein